MQRQYYFAHNAQLVWAEPDPTLLVSRSHTLSCFERVWLRETIMELGKRQRHISDDGADRAASKCAQYAQCDGALLCLPLQLQSDHPTAEQLAVELARCLQESKYHLLKEAVDVLGAERAIELFTKTADTQKQGGVLTADGNKKRAPGGVYFSLIKNSVTQEEKKRIFAKDNMLAAKRAKKAKEARNRKKWKEEEEKKSREIQDKAWKQLGLFRKELAAGRDGSKQTRHLPDRNVEWREKGCWKEDNEIGYVDLDNPVSHDDGELNEGWRNGFGDDDQDDFTSHVRVYEQLRSLSSPDRNTTLGDIGPEGKDDQDKGRVVKDAVEGNKAIGQITDDSSLEEKIAAEQFERTDECDVGIDLCGII